MFLLEINTPSSDDIYAYIQQSILVIEAYCTVHRLIDVLPKPQSQNQVTIDP